MFLVNLYQAAAQPFLMPLVAVMVEAVKLHGALVFVHVWVWVLGFGAPVSHAAGAVVVEVQAHSAFLGSSALASRRHHRPKACFLKFLTHRSFATPADTTKHESLPPALSPVHADFKQAQVKAVSFLAYLLRSAQQHMLPHAQVRALCFGVLNAVPHTPCCAGVCAQPTPHPHRQPLDAP